MTFASCVRGHLLHARCFQGRLLAGRGCPVCPEALFVPRVQRVLRDGEDNCCGAEGQGDSSVLAALEQVQAAEVAASQQATGVEAGTGETVGQTVTNSSGSNLTLKMCPVCCAGPLLNENCSDLRAHHGQCPRCGSYPHSPAAIAEALVKAGSGAHVGERIPKCPDCSVAVLFSGCAECGHIFADIDWDDLPAWDNSAKGVLGVEVRHRKAARLLAEQVRYEAALLAHERTSLEEARKTPMPVIEEVELPAPPKPLPPRCGPQCTRSHKGPCLVCDRDWDYHSCHTCEDGRRGSWLLVPGTWTDGGEEEEEEEE